MKQVKVLGLTVEFKENTKKTNFSKPTRNICGITYARLGEDAKERFVNKISNACNKSPQYMRDALTRWAKPFAKVEAPKATPKATPKAVKSNSGANLDELEMLLEETNGSSVDIPSKSKVGKKIEQSAPVAEPIRTPAQTPTQTPTQTPAVKAEKTVADMEHPFDTPKATPKSEVVDDLIDDLDEALAYRPEVKVEVKAEKANKPKQKRTYKKRQSKSDMTPEKLSIGKAIDGLEAKMKSDKVNLKALRNTFGNMR